MIIIIALIAVIITLGYIAIIQYQKIQDIKQVLRETEDERDLVEDIYGQLIDLLEKKEEI